MVFQGVDRLSWRGEERQHGLYGKHALSVGNTESIRLSVVFGKVM